MNGFEIDGDTGDLFKAFSLKIANLEEEMGNYIANRLNLLLHTRYNASGIKNRTGALERSISCVYNSSSHAIQVGVKIYGLFLSYGVGPKAKGGKVYNIDEWVLKSLNGAPQGGNQFSYDSNYRKFGIKARKWIPGDEALDLILQDFINDYTKS